MADKDERAVEIFSKGFNCAQSVFSTYAPELGIGEEESMRVSSGFGGGMARLQEVCGAVTGAFMVIGCKYGSSDAKDNGAKMKTYRVVRVFEKRFRELHGTILCREILGIDLNTEDGQMEFKEKGMAKAICAQCVRDAAKILEEID